MNTWSSRNLIRLSAIAVVLTMGIAPGAWAQDEGWNFDLGIYGWLPTIEGKLAYEIPELGDELEVDPGALIDNLQFTAEQLENFKKTFSVCLEAKSYLVKY